MPDTRIELIKRAVEIGRHLVAICNSLNQPVAGDHIACGVDLLEAHSDLEAELASQHAGEGAVDERASVRG